MKKKSEITSQNVTSIGRERTPLKVAAKRSEKSYRRYLSNLQRKTVQSNGILDVFRTTLSSLKAHSSVSDVVARLKPSLLNASTESDFETKVFKLVKKGFVERGKFLPVIVDILLGLENEQCLITNRSGDVHLIPFKDALNKVAVLLLHLDAAKPSEVLLRFIPRLGLLRALVKHKLVGKQILFSLAAVIMTCTSGRIPHFLSEFLRTINSMSESGDVKFTVEEHGQIEMYTCYLYRFIDLCNLQAQDDFVEIYETASEYLAKVKHQHSDRCIEISRPLAHIHKSAMMSIVDELWSPSASLPDLLTKFSPDCSKTLKKGDYLEFAIKVLDLIASQKTRWHDKFKCDKDLDCFIGKMSGKSFNPKLPSFDFIVKAWCARNFPRNASMTVKAIDQGFTHSPWLMYEFCKKRLTTLLALLRGRSLPVEIKFSKGPTSNMCYYYYRLFRSFFEFEDYRQVFEKQPIKSKRNFQIFFDYFRRNVEKFQFKNQREAIDFVNSIPESSLPWNPLKIVITIDDEEEEEILLSNIISSESEVDLSFNDDAENGAIEETEKIENSQEVMNEIEFAKDNKAYQLESEVAAEDNSDSSVNEPAVYSFSESQNTHNEHESQLSKLTTSLKNLRGVQFGLEGAEVLEKVFTDFDDSEESFEKTVYMCRKLSKIKGSDGQKFVGLIQQHLLSYLVPFHNQRDERKLAAFRFKQRMFPRLVGELYSRKKLPLSFMLSYFEALVNTRNVHSYHGLRDLLAAAGKTLEEDANNNGLQYLMANSFAVLSGLRLLPDTTPTIREVVNEIFALRKNGWTPLDEKQKAAETLNSLLAEINPRTAQKPQEMLFAKEAVLDYLESAPSSLSNLFYNTMLNKLQQNAFEMAKYVAPDSPVPIRVNEFCFNHVFKSEKE